MNRVKLVCRLCGKTYEACTTPGIGSFRWQDVTCCREHWDEYHRKIVESRKQQDVERQVKEK